MRIILCEANFLTSYIFLQDDASETRTHIVLKPTAKPVSRATASLLSNLQVNYLVYFDRLKYSLYSIVVPSIFFALKFLSVQGSLVGSAQRRQPDVANNIPSAEQGKQNHHSSVQRQLNRSELDARNNRQQTRRDRPSCDGYNWRKYGQKQVKESEYPRSYYKCTHPSCPVKKKVERSLIDGQIAEIVYKGEHNHPKPRPPMRLSSGSQEQSLVGSGAGADENSRETAGNLSWSTAAGSPPLEVNPKKLMSRIPTSSVQVHLPEHRRPIDADCGGCNADQLVGGATIRVCRAPSRKVMTKDRDMLIDCKRRYM